MKKIKYPILVDGIAAMLSAPLSSTLIYLVIVRMGGYDYSIAIDTVSKPTLVGIICVGALLTGTSIFLSFVSIRWLYRILLRRN